MVIRGLMPSSFFRFNDAYARLNGSGNLLRTRRRDFNSARLCEARGDIFLFCFSPFHATIIRGIRMIAYRKTILRDFRARACTTARSRRS